MLEFIVKYKTGGRVARNSVISLPVSFFDVLNQLSMPDAVDHQAGIVPRI